MVHGRRVGAFARAIGSGVSHENALPGDLVGPAVTRSRRTVRVLFPTRPHHAAAIGAGRRGRVSLCEPATGWAP